MSKIDLDNYRGEPVIVFNDDSIDAINSQFSVINMGDKPIHVRYINCDVFGRMDTRSHTVINNYNRKKNHKIVCHIFIQPESSDHPFRVIDESKIPLEKFK